jgi:transcriptional regulator with XRE-family HTH domain
MLAVQCKMARVALGLGVRELATLASVSPNTIARLERGEEMRESTLAAIQRALEDAGVEFTNGDQPGVRMKAGFQPSAPAPEFDPFGGKGGFQTHVGEPRRSKPRASEDDRPGRAFRREENGDGK